MKYQTDYKALEQIKELAAQGLSSKEIGLIVGKTAKAVQKYFRRHNIPCLKQGGPKGSRNGSWKGGKQMDKDGYVLLLRPDHPFANSNGYVREHRLVMEAHLGRYLQPNEIVHHKDGNHSNNSVENLEVFSSNTDHLKETLKGRVPNWSEEGFERMKENGRKLNQWWKAQKEA